MSDFRICELHNAPPAAVEDLERVQAKNQFIPNLMGIMANSPSVLKGYLTLNKLFEETSFSPLENNVVLLTVSVANGCDYCIAAHSMAAKMQKVSDDVISSIRDDKPLSDMRSEALRLMTREVVNSRGWPNEEIVKQFYDAGFSHAQALEVILGVAMKTLSNYINHLADTSVDEQFLDQ